MPTITRRSSAKPSVKAAVREVAHGAGPASGPQRYRWGLALSAMRWRIHDAAHAVGDDESRPLMLEHGANSAAVRAVARAVAPP